MSLLTSSRSRCTRCVSIWFLASTILSLLGFAQVESKGTTHLVVVDKSDFRLYVYEANKLVCEFPIAVGMNPGDKQKRGDHRTPEGNFYIVQIQDSRNWSHDFKDGKGPTKGAYGPWFLRLYTGAKATKSGKAWSGVAVHGTHDPNSIGTRATEGCVRLRNDDLQKLKRMVKVGTPVTIRE